VLSWSEWEVHYILHLQGLRAGPELAMQDCHGKGTVMESAKRENLRLRVAAESIPIGFDKSLGPKRFGNLRIYPSNIRSIRIIIAIFYFQAYLLNIF